VKELEIKGVLPDLDALRERLRLLGIDEELSGVLEDRRLDDGSGSIRARDEMLRVRALRREGGGGVVQASLDWKGPARVIDGYKVREEISTPIGDPGVLLAVLGRAGLTTALALDRAIWQYRVAGAMVRLERYPRMDDLIEIEGEPEQIEAAVRTLGLDRSSLGGDSLPAFIARFETRTGQRASLCIVNQQ
jgi:adenylate cyclase class IV